MNKLCQLTYLLSLTKNLVSSLVLSSLDYCNAFLAGSPQVLLDRIQRVTNCSARFICKAPKSAHITALRSPLVINQKPDLIQNRSNLIPPSTSLSCFISTLLQPPHPPTPTLSLSLRTASDIRIFRIPRMGRRTTEKRSFQYTETLTWNSLPLSVSYSSSFSSFKSKLKTHLFSSA